MYANYQTSWSTDAGLAFLFPHVWELRSAKDETEKGNRLSELFRFVVYPGYTEVTRGSGTKSACALRGAEADNEDSLASSGLRDLLVTMFTSNWNSATLTRADGGLRVGNSLMIRWRPDIERGIQPAR